MYRIPLLTLPLGALALVIACSHPSSSPTAPGAAGRAAAAATEGATLKANAPVPVSPINNVAVAQGAAISLVVTNATMQFVSEPLRYQFEIYNAANALVFQSPLVTSGSGTTAITVTAQLEAEKPYTWQARAENGGAFGPWSSRAAFVSPRNDGYIRGSELYDPLTNGRTVGTIVGNVTFIPGVGARMDDFGARIVYQLPEPLEDGEYSALVSGVATNTKGDKTKIISMAQGYGDLTANERRMTVEKRGDNPTGGVAFRFLTNGEGAETVGEERVVREFDPAQTYFWEADWRDGFFRLRINRGGVNGPNIYNFGKPYDGFYRPEPHVIYAGGGPARAGLEAQTVPGMIIRQIWVSQRPRPSFANQ
jgi:hypothetical protein